MATSDEYQRFAVECMSWARGAKTDAERKAFLDMARAWTIAGREGEWRGRAGRRHVV